MKNTEKNNEKLLCKGVKFKKNGKKFKEVVFDKGVKFG
jgi:hypothetical protein